jgi:DNA-binding NarL/FixJ family response regulator
MRPATKARRERIVALFRQGLTPKQIAHEVGRDRVTVCHHLRAVGISATRIKPRVPTEAIHAMRREGLSLYKIELVSGYSRGALYHRLKREGARQ